MSYVLMRTDQGGGFVARSGSPSAYVGDFRWARQYGSVSAAELDRCPGNEIILEVSGNELRVLSRPPSEIRSCGS